LAEPTLLGLAALLSLDQDDTADAGLRAAAGIARRASGDEFRKAGGTSLG
jgi:hypothetical protein